MKKETPIASSGVELHDIPGAPQVLQVRLAGWVKALFISISLILVGVVTVLYFQYREMQTIRDARKDLLWKNERLLRDYQKLTLQSQDKEETIDSLQTRLNKLKVDLEEAQKTPPLSFSANLFSKKTPSPLDEDSNRLMETLANLFPTLPAYRSGPYVVVQLPGAYFESGATELPPQVLEEMAIIAKVFEFYSGDYYMAVEGHTDSTPGARSNWRIGSERAERVLDYMIRLGVPPSKLALVSRAEYMPLNPSPEGNQNENRRIELVFAPNRIIKKGHSISAILEEEKQKILHQMSETLSEPTPQVETNPQNP